MSNRVGQQFGNYRLLRLLGIGGFAEVYLGEHVIDKTLAAVKVLRMHMPHADVDSFLQEARTIARLEHPHIIRLLEFGVSDQESIPFLVMSYASNGTLREYYPKGVVLLADSILDIVKQIASALQYAHDQNLIHRDIKPENMLLGPYNRVLLSDFGLAIIAQSSRHLYPQGVAGTIPYMAPEQFQGKPRPASDQYALGVTVYEWLCGTLPFVGTPAEIQAQHLHASAEPLRKRVPSISSAVEEVVLTALAKDPYQRFMSVQDFATALEQACAQPNYAVRKRIWNVPYLRNPFFTGREEVLMRLRDLLRRNRTAALTHVQAITGLGGIGKTQTAIEYAYRNRHYYHTVLWFKADSPDILISEFVNAAQQLDLQEKNEQDQNRIVTAVKRWLEAHTSWLLIFDNVEDPEKIAAYLPSTKNGHILLTTRTQLPNSIAQHIDLDKMELDEAALFLLRRINMISSRDTFKDVPLTELTTAREIAEALDGLPLALDQAAAYIEETDCRLVGYLQRYRSYQTKLLEIRHGPASKVRQRSLPDHPEPVTKTLALSLEKVHEASAASADLLRLCAFLYPDGIAEEILTEGAPELGRTLRSVAKNTLTLDEIIAESLRYSLIRRDAEARTLSIHRLVQAVLKESMTKNMQRQWAERTVRAVNRAFPDVKFETWQRCQRCLPHAQTCASLIEQWSMTFPEAIQLLDRTGLYLQERAQYAQAEALLQRSLMLREQTLGSEHLGVAASIDALADVYFSEGKYVLADSLFQRSLAIREKFLAPDHPDLAISLKNAAHISYFIDSTKYERSEERLLRAQTILEKTFGPEHLEVADNLDRLAIFYDYQRKYAQAEPLWQRVREIREKILGSRHPAVGGSIYDLAHLYCIEGKYAQAEPLLQQALAIFEETLGPEHSDVASVLDSMAMLALDQGKYAQAEPLFQRAVAITEKVLGLKHPKMAQILDNVALLYGLQGRYTQAEPLAKESLAIHEQTPGVGPEHADVAFPLNTLAGIYLPQGKYNEAASALQRAITVLERDRRPDNPTIAETWRKFGVLSLAQGHYDQAESFFQRSLTMLEKTMGSEHLDTATCLHDTASLLFAQGKHDQAELLCKQALGIREKILGPGHPDVAQCLHTLASLRCTQQQYEEAEQYCRQALAMYERFLGPFHLYIAQCLTTLAKIELARRPRDYVRIVKALYQRALYILEGVFGPNHPAIASCLHGEAEFAYTQGKYAQALKLCKQAVTMRETLFGTEHPDVAQSLALQANIYHAQGKYEEARPLYERAIAIRDQILGREHPDTGKSRESYAALIEKFKLPRDCAQPC